MPRRSIDFWHILNSAAYPTEQAMQSEAPSSKYTIARCNAGLREERDICIAERMSVSEAIAISVALLAPNRRFSGSSPNVSNNDKRQQCRLDDTLLLSFAVPTIASFAQSEKHLPSTKHDAHYSCLFTRSPKFYSLSRWGHLCCWHLYKPSVCSVEEEIRTTTPTRLALEKHQKRQSPTFKNKPFKS